ncbi:unnamed protein product [Rhodiola kirilowii]
MFDSGYRTHNINGNREKFVRLDELDSSVSLSALSRRRGLMERCGSKIGQLSRFFRVNGNPSRIKNTLLDKGSEKFQKWGGIFKAKLSRLLAPKDLKVSDKPIFDPQDRAIQFWNRLFVISCILAVSVDPLFLYLPIIRKNCLGIDEGLIAPAIAWRTVIDAFYIIRIVFQFRTAYIAPSSRVFGKGELVTDTRKIAKRYLLRYFFVDLVSILPLPQIVVYKYARLKEMKNVEVYATKQALLVTILLQYIPRFVRFIPLTSEVKKSAGAFVETAWAGAAYYLLWYLLASHIVGASWYLLAVERNDECWQRVCHRYPNKCKEDYLYCANKHKRPKGYQDWLKISRDVLSKECSGHASFNYGIYTSALTSGVVSLENEAFSQKFCYCLWWGLQNLSTLGQGLQTSTYPGEVLFSITLAIFGLILFALLIGNMQTSLQSVTIRLEEMRIKRRDSEQWMHHRSLPQELRDSVRRYDQYKWLETHGVDEENLVRNLPKDIRKDIKRHLCLRLVRRVPLFANMDESLLDAICERLKPSLFTLDTYVHREGDPVNEMLFIIRGTLESVTTDGGRSGFFNRSLLKEGDFCGEELLTWALDPKAGSNFPLSTRTVKAVTEVEAFALEAEELRYVASQFRRLHSRQVQHTFRFYSQQWRTWAAIFIQAAWRRYTKRKRAELYQKEGDDDYVDIDEEEYMDERQALLNRETSLNDSSRLGATMYVSKFAANAMRGVQRFRNSMGSKSLMKPEEPDFSADDD